MLFESNAGFQNVAVFSNALQTVCMYLCDSYFNIVSCSVPINHSLFHLVKKIYIFFSIEIHSSHDKCTRFNFAFNFLQYDYDLSNHLPALNLLGVGFHITSVLFCLSLTPLPIPLFLSLFLSAGKKVTEIPFTVSIRHMYKFIFRIANI